MYLKNKIISGLLILALAAAIVPASAKAAPLNLDEMQALIVQLQSQIAQLTQNLAAFQAGATGQTTSSPNSPEVTGPSGVAIQAAGSQWVPSNSSGVTYSSPTYQNPSDCPAPATNSSCNSPYAAWAKNPNNGECCQYASSCQAPQTGNWNVYSTQESCGSAKTSCLINGDSCCQNGKCYPLTNNCTNGTTPYIYQCDNYGSYCTPITRCSAGKTVVAANCAEKCKSLGLAGGKCVSLSSYFENKGMNNPYDLNQNIIGKTTDCMTCTDPDGAVGCANGSQDYCGCNLPSEPNVPFGQPGYQGMDSACEALCNTQGYNFGSCHVLLNQTNMVCSSSNGGDGDTVYAGTTNVCKPGANWTAGCCCFALSRSGSSGGITAWGVSTPSAPAVNKANGQKCASNSECTSKVCNCGYCVPGSGYCGSGLPPNNYVASGATASYGTNYFNGVCNNGVWNVVAGGYGCTVTNSACSPSTLSCVSGQTCNKGVANGQCVANGSVSKKASGQSCTAGSECSSGYCNCGYCVPGSGYCGSGLPPNNYVANGEKASYGTNYFNGVCNNGVWNVVGGGYGCTVTNSACSPSTLSCVSGYTCNTGVANGKCQ